VVTTEHRLKSAAAAAKVPVSRWVATLVKDKTRVCWPDAVRNLRGALSNFPQLDDLRREFGRVPNLSVVNWFD